MKLTVNQQSIETEAKNLEELVAELNLPNQGVAGETQRMGRLRLDRRCKNHHYQSCLRRVNSCSFFFFVLF